MNKLGIVVAGSLLSISAFADDGVTLGGYVDAGYTAVSQDKQSSVETSDVNGFLVREGAVYLGKKWGTEWEVFSDFAYANTGFANGSSFGVSQAFVANNMDNGFGWKLGQFDGIFGYYAGRSDSHAHNLTDKGYINKAYLPATHLGWMGTYSFSDMLKFNVLVANDNETVGVSSNASATNTPSGTRHPDFGVLVNADFDAFSADLGAYFMTGEDNSAGGGNKSDLGYLVSAVFEGNMNPLTFGVYGVYFKNDVEDNATGKNGSDFGVGATAGYAINDKAGADLRVEYVSMKDKTSYYNPISKTWSAVTNAAEVNNVMAGTIGGHWKFNDNVKAKIDYTYGKVDTDATPGLDADVDPFHIVQAGVVANF